ncbi:MAG: hypothetical protein B6241_06300 [Spirochaetaceae bacterium 4572_59]|nr:MAG: hypothetical protein B6241_06300 [Spirochaetaceae bacterium 4572_59]
MEHKLPLISAIIPVYNRPLQIKDAILSVLNQSWRPLELIVGDDGSDDETILEIRKLQEQAEKATVEMQILELKHSGFPGDVRNSCVRAARGELLAFLDSDDIWKPEKLSRQAVAFEENPDLEISHTREEWRRAGRIISQSKMRHKREGDIFKDALKKCIIGPSTVMLRKDYYLESGGFRTDLEIAEDYEYWLRLTADTSVTFLDEPLTIKKAGHSDQLSEKYGHIEIFRIQGLKDLVDSEYFQGWHRQAAQRELSRKCLVYGRGCIKREKQEEGQEYLDLSGYYEILADKGYGGAC